MCLWLKTAKNLPEIAKELFEWKSGKSLLASIRGSRTKSRFQARFAAKVVLPDYISLTLLTEHGRRSFGEQYVWAAFWRAPLFTATRWARLVHTHTEAHPSNATVLASSAEPVDRLIQTGWCACSYPLQGIKSAGVCVFANSSKVSFQAERAFNKKTTAFLVCV